jgi:glucose uptake protein
LVNWEAVLAVGFALALLSMVFFGLYMVPRKFSGLRNMEFVLSMAFGVLLTMLAAWFISRNGSRSPVPAGTMGYAFLCGPIWTLGMMAFTLAVDDMGLTLATPIKNTTAVMGSLVGLLFFRETLHTVAWMALAGSGLIVLCAVVIGQAGEGSDVHYSLSARGTVYSLIAAVFFAGYTYPLKVAMESGLDSYTIVLLMALGTLTTAALGQLLQGGSLLHWWRRPFPDHLHAGLAGSLWSLATLFMNAAIARIGLAVTWPITNLNTVIAVLIGAYFFREVHLGNHWRKLIQGVVFAALGVLLLGLSKK